MRPDVRPRYAPYAGRTPPFSIALAPLDPAEWLAPDGRRADELTLREAILRDEADAFMASPETEASQREVLRLIEEHLLPRGFDRGLAERAPHDAPPLYRAALMVQDDLVIMRRGDAAYHLAAAALCFPSSWRLAEKFGKPMDTIHEDVPGWAGPMATRVNRIFDALRPGAIVWRLNWSIQSGEGLRQSHSKHDATVATRLDDAILVRVERQTLRRLDTGDILFTIMVMLDPIEGFTDHPDGSTLAGALAEQLGGLDADQLAYKGLGPTRDDLVARLRKLQLEAAS